jgi:prepilin-type processing-associated H-X9-DG protein
MENCGRFAWRVDYGGPDDGGCNSISWGLGADEDAVMKGWHGLPFRFNVAFSDGHAAGVFMQGHEQPEPRLGRYPDFGGNYTSHDTWRCVIIRGPDWQVDTLPAPPVETNISCANAGVPVHGIE